MPEVRIKGAKVSSERASWLDQVDFCPFRGPDAPFALHRSYHEYGKSALGSHHHTPPQNTTTTQCRDLRTECSEMVDSVRRGPAQRLSSLSMISASPATIRFALRRGDSRKLVYRLFRISTMSMTGWIASSLRVHRLGSPGKLLGACGRKNP
jgi:hypothetical protein